MTDEFSPKHKFTCECGQKSIRDFDYKPPKGIESQARKFECTGCGEIVYIFPPIKITKIIKVKPIKEPSEGVQA